jgi:RHS repeat-associated protein
VRDLTNASGVVQDHLDYDGFGKATESNTSFGDRYKYTGREYDSTTGLQYNRTRYYDPATGRWTSEDPIGFQAGDSNLYRYVGNNPTNAIDPKGTDIIYLMTREGSPIAQLAGHGAVLIGPDEYGTYWFYSYSTGRDLSRADDDIDVRPYCTFRDFIDDKDRKISRYKYWLWFSTDLPINEKAKYYMDEVGTTKPYRLFRHNCAQIVVDAIGYATNGRIRLNRWREPKNIYLDKQNQGKATFYSGGESKLPNPDTWDPSLPKPSPPSNPGKPIPR